MVDRVNINLNSTNIIITQNVGIWCLTPLSTLFQLYRGDKLYWWRKLVYLEKTTDLPQITEKLYHILIEYTTP